MPNWVTPVQAIAALAKLHAKSGLPGGEESHWRKAESTVFEKMFAAEIRTLAERSLYIFPYGPEHRENRHVTPQFWHTWKITRNENRYADWVTGELRIYNGAGGGGTLIGQVVGLKLDAETIPWGIDATLADLGNSEPGYSPAETFATYEEVVKWCRDWIESGKGNGMDKAWPDFKKLPKHAGRSREHVFRPAWNEAKRK